MLDAMQADLRYAWRAMRRAPLFTAIAIASLALGIGANTAIFSLVDQVLLRSIAARDPGQLVLLESPGPQRAMVFGRYAFSYPMYRDLRDSNRVFEGLAARYPTPVTLSAPGGQGLRVDAELVSGNFFQTLGVGPLLGRTLNQADTARPGAAAVAVLDAAFWRTRFGADPQIIGRTVRLNGQPYEIAGVAANSFRGVQPGYRPAFYLPLTMKRQLTPTWDELDNRRALWLQLIGRLNPGLTSQQAQAGLQPLYQAILAEELKQMPGDVTGNFRRRFLSRPLLLQSAAGGIPLLRQETRAPLFVLMAMVALVLLIACANVANLLLARAAARRKEIAVRLALGARRSDLLRQLMAESLLLALAGGAAGLAVASWTLEALLRLLPQNGWRLALSPQLDWRVLAFTAALALLTGLLFGLLPALQATRPDATPVLKEATSSPSRRALRFKQGLVVAQVALSVLLLAASGLFLRTLINLKTVDTGFRTASLLSFEVDVPLAGLPPAATAQTYAALRRRYASLPGVSHAVLAENSLLSGNFWQMTVGVEGYQAREGENLNPQVNSVSEGFFSALGMPLAAGREFTDADTAAAPRVAVVNEHFARYFFKDQSPIGRRFGIADRPRDITIVGVVRDGRSVSLREEPTRRIYLPFRQSPDLGGVTFYVRTAADPDALISTLRKETAAAVPGLALFEPRTVERQLDDSVASDRLLAVLCSAFGLLAALLAAIGLYGVMAWSVARRTREIGIRMALGAPRAGVLKMVQRESALLALLGIALGLPLALALRRLVDSLLFGLKPNDPWVYASAALLLFAIALAAGFWPARQASRTDPLVALRYE